MDEMRKVRNEEKERRISEKPIWSPRMCLQSSSQSRENILRPYKTQSPDGCNVANCLILIFPLL